METWKEIPGYDYKVSNTGKVYSNRRNKEMKLKTTKDGYKALTLSKPNKRKEFTVHRLVALAFIDNPENKPQVNHINGIKDDNRASNLEWSTQSENQLHAYTTGLQKPLGVHNKLSIDEASEICEAYATGMFTYTEIAKHFNMTTSNMRRMIIGESYGVISISTRGA